MSTPYSIRISDETLPDLTDRLGVTLDLNRADQRATWALEETMLATRISGG